MSKGLGNIMKMAKQAQAKIMQVQDEMASRSVEASSGGGMVVATVNGKQELLALKIEPDVLQDGDVEMVQDLVVAAVNEAMRKAQEMVAEEMSKVTGGMNLPGLF
ncbi:MAG: YbaB/EbfC family nucleoid-associated protein [Candidatus Alcyoniella australis]|nr:YbaB/EbfC family nucleoid-associated protein [Candidatus Alcyoniella australis]